MCNFVAIQGIRATTKVFVKFPENSKYTHTCLELQAVVQPEIVQGGGGGYKKNICMFDLN